MRRFDGKSPVQIHGKTRLGEVEGVRKVAGESFIEWNGGFFAIAGCLSRGAALPAACLC
jgi:hypothetical protein